MIYFGIHIRTFTTNRVYKEWVSVVVRVEIQEK